MAGAETEVSARQATMISRRGRTSYGSSPKRIDWTCTPVIVPRWPRDGPSSAAQERASANAANVDADADADAEQTQTPRETRRTIAHLCLALRRRTQLVGPLLRFVEERRDRLRWKQRRERTVIALGAYRDDVAVELVAQLRCARRLGVREAQRRLERCKRGGGALRGVLRGRSIGRGQRRRVARGGDGQGVELRRPRRNGIGDIKRVAQRADVALEDGGDGGLHPRRARHAADEDDRGDVGCGEAALSKQRAQRADKRVLRRSAEHFEVTAREVIQILLPVCHCQGERVHFL